MRTLRNLAAAREEINRRPVGVDGIAFEAYRSPRDYVSWNPNALYIFDDPNPLKYLQLRILHQETPDAAEQVYAKGRPVERGTVADAIINKAIIQKLNKTLDRFFSPSSWGYRPRRSPELAIRQVRQAIRGGAHWALKTDVRRFFPNINRALLRQQLDQTIHDHALVDLITSQISPVLITRDGRYVLERVGLPEGNGLTPWLSNLHLHGFDEICTPLFAFYARYADDLLVLGHSREEVLKAKRLIQSALSRLGLELNRDKTTICDLHRQPITFLGYELRGGNIYPPSKAIRQLAQKLQVRGQKDRKNLLRAFVHRYRIGPVRKLFRRLHRTFNQLLPPGVTLVGLLDESRAEGVRKTRGAMTTHLGTSPRRGRTDGA